LSPPRPHGDLHSFPTRRSSDLRRKAAETQAAVFGQQLQDMQTRLQRAKQLREEWADQERLHRIYDWLARDLRNDRFQAYLLEETDRKSTRLNSSHDQISYAVFC